MHRRSFLMAAAGAAARPAAASICPEIALGAGRTAPNDRIQVAVIGVRGRGNSLLRTFAARDDVDVRYVCDVDQGVLRNRVAETEQRTRRRPRAIGDFRRAIEDSAIDAIVLGTPDHWHAIPSVLACMAEKDVYTEKPDGHDVEESLRMMQAARKHRRVVQLGTHARSAPHLHQAAEYLRSGAIGRVHYATSWESARQGSLGRPADRAVPAGVDYDMWLGPAPKRPFNRLRFHGNWRWFFDYGCGDLGNDGVHRIDYALWGLEAALAAQGDELSVYPKRASAVGGKYSFDDAQEWPDTLMASYDFGNSLLTYEMRIWTPYPLHGHAEGAAVYGDRGYVVLASDRWNAYAKGGAEVKEASGSTNLDQTALHVANFLDCMRSRKRPNADLETVGHRSSMLCHLGNASWRAGRDLRFDEATRSFAGADEYLRRKTYREPWRLPSLGEI